MRLERLYNASFTTPESWRVGLDGPFGSEEQNFLIAEGRSEGRLSARLRGANFPRRRADGTLLPDFRGVLETDDGATILYSWTGYARASGDGMRELVGGISHLSDDPRYAWLNNAYCALVGEVRPRSSGGFDVVFEVSEIVWEATG
jgi:hypothetical protein